MAMFEEIKVPGEGVATFVDLEVLMDRELAWWHEDYEEGCMLCGRKTERQGVVIMDPANGGQLAVKKKGTPRVLEQNAFELGMTCMKRVNKALEEFGYELQ